MCVALSGGRDSLALFTFFAENAEKSDIALSAVHVEHGIRGEDSLADAAFVRALCEGARVPLFLFHADIPALAAAEGEGVEEAARRLRLQIFTRLIEEDKADFVATAHHAGDNAESVLFNLFRGASLTGAGGIRAFLPVRGDRGIVRPFLGCTREEIESYLLSRGARWREDASNADAAYTRNFLRHKVLAPAKERFPACERAVGAFSRAAREDDDYLFSLTDGYVREGEEFVIRPAPLPVLRRCCIRALRFFGIEKDYTSAHIDAMCALLEKESGAEADLPRGIRAVNDYGEICVFPARRDPVYEYPFGEGDFDCGGFVLSVRRGVSGGAEGEKALFFDGRALPEDAVIRPRREGDVFKKFGGGSKKLKEFFIDKKIPARRRGLYPLIAAGKQVFAVCGLEIADSVRGERGADGDFSRPEEMFTALLRKKGERHG